MASGSNANWLSGVWEYVAENWNTLPMWSARLIIASLVYSITVGGTVYLIGDRLISHSLSTTNGWLESLDGRLTSLDDRIDDLSADMAQDFFDALQKRSDIEFSVKIDLSSLEERLDSLNQVGSLSLRLD